MKRSNVSVFLERSNRALLWWSVGMLLPAAHYLSVILKLNYLVPGTLSFLLWSLLPRSGRRVSDRAVIYSFVAALALTAFGNYLAPAERGIHSFAFFFLRLRVMGPLTLFLAALAAGFRRREHLLGLSALALFFAFGVGSDAGNAALHQQRWMLGENILSFSRFYLWHAVPAVGTLLAAHLWYDRPATLRPLCRLAEALALTAAFTAGGLLLHRRYGESFRTFSHHLVNWEWYDHFQRSRSLAAELPQLSGDLKRAFPLESPERQAEALFFVQGQDPPRYWRVSVFSWYRRGSWSTRASAADKRDRYELEIDPEFLTQPIIHADQRYRLLTRPVKRLRPCELYFGAWKGGHQLPSPGQAALLHVVADRVERCDDGTIAAYGIVEDAGATFFCDPALPEAGQLPLLKENPEALFYLDVPRHLRRLLSDHLFYAGVSPEAADAVNGARLIDYLRTNYTYATDWPSTPPYLDPVTFFLSERRRGHCELFASALTLLLRQSGIPARYVTGILCYEYDGDAAHFVMRRRHLHAWVEAYDRDRDEWILLDPTPGSEAETAVRSTVRPTPSSFWRHIFLSFLARLRRGHWIGWIAGWFYNFYESFGSWSGSWFWILLATGAILYFFRCWKKRRASLSPRWKMSRELDHFCRPYVRRGILKKASIRQSTAAEISSMLRRSPELTPAEKETAERFLKKYLTRRYGAEKGEP